MKKLSTLFKKDPNDLSLVTKEVNKENEWVYSCGLPTRKFDGTACAIINGEIYKRFDAKRNKKTGQYKKVPEDAIPCQEPDEKSGHWPHWVKCDRGNPNDKYIFEGFDSLPSKSDGTYELCGEKVQGNPEKIKGHELIRHGSVSLEIEDFTYDSLKDFLSKKDIEGIVFHAKDGSSRMCKIRKSDFGIKR